MAETITCTYGGKVYDITEYANEYESQYEASEQFLIGNAPSEEITLKIDTSRMDQATVMACRKAEMYSIKNKSYYIYNAPTSWAGLVTLTLYDKMMKTNEKFLTASWEDYASNIIARICSRYGIRNGSNITRNDKITVAKSDTARQVIGKVAGMYGMNAFIASNDVLAFRKLGGSTNALPFAYDYSIKETRSIGKVSWTNGSKKYEKAINGRWLYTLPASVNGNTLKGITYNGKSYTAGDELELFEDADIMIERDTDGNDKTATTAQDDIKNGSITLEHGETSATQRLCTLKQLDGMGFIDVNAFEEYYNAMRYKDYITAGEAEASMNEALASLDSDAFHVTVKDEKGETLWTTYTYRKDGKEFYRMPERYKTYRATEYKAGATKYTPGTVAEFQADTVLTLAKIDIKSLYAITFKKADGSELARYSIHADYDANQSAYAASYTLGESVGGLYAERYTADGNTYKNGDTIKITKDTAVTVTLKAFNYSITYSNALTREEAETITVTGEGVKTVGYSLPESVGGYVSKRYIGEDGTLYSPGDSLTVSGDMAFSARLVMIDDKYCAVYLINCKSGKAEQVDSLTMTDANLSTMYIDGANEYITQKRIDAIMKKYAGLEFSTFTTLKGQKPADGNDYMPGDFVTYDGITFLPQTVKTARYQIGGSSSGSDIYDGVEMSNDMTLSGTEETTGTGSMANNYITQRNDFTADGIPAGSISYDKLDDNLTGIIDGAKEATEEMLFLKVKRKKLTLSESGGTMLDIPYAQNILLNCNAVYPDDHYNKIPHVVSVQPCSDDDKYLKTSDGDEYTILSLRINDDLYGIKVTSFVGDATVIKTDTFLSTSTGIVTFPENSVNWWMYYIETDEKDT